MKKRGEADELRRQIAAQHSANTKLRGMPNDNFDNKQYSKSKSKDKKLPHVPQIDELNEEDITLDNLRKSKKLRKLVKGEIKKNLVLTVGLAILTTLM